jgi:hypothetical protein
MLGICNTGKMYVLIAGLIDGIYYSLLSLPTTRYDWVNKRILANTAYQVIVDCISKTYGSQVNIFHLIIKKKKCKGKKIDLVHTVRKKPYSHARLFESMTVSSLPMK